jgi:hypothetical protein
VIAFTIRARSQWTTPLRPRNGWPAPTLDEPFATTAIVRSAGWRSTALAAGSSHAPTARSRDPNCPTAVALSSSHGTNIVARFAVRAVALARRGAADFPIVGLEQQSRASDDIAVVVQPDGGRAFAESPRTERRANAHRYH